MHGIIAPVVVVLAARAVPANHHCCTIGVSASAPSPPRVWLARFCNTLCHFSICTPSKTQTVALGIHETNARVHGWVFASISVLMQ